MAFVDFLNKTSEVIASNIDSPNNSIQETHRCLILDNDSRLSSVYKRIDSHFTRIVNSEILYITDEDIEEIDVKKFLGYSERRIYLAVICYDPAALDKFLKVLFNYIEVLKMKDGNTTKSYLKLNLFYIFDRNENKTKEENNDLIKEECRKLCKVLSGTFNNDVNKFPDCSVVFKLFIEKDNDIEKIEYADEVFNLHINSNVQGEAVNALYIESNDEVSKFTEDTVPWIAYKIHESFIPEQIVLRSVYNRFSSMIKDDRFAEQLNENNTKLINQVKERIFTMLGISGYTQVEDEFDSSKEFFPVESSENEWEQKKTTIEVKVTDDSDDGIISKFKKIFKKEEAKPIQKVIDDFKKSVFNDDPQISWNQYKFFVKDKITPKRMCAIVIDSLASINLSINERVYPRIRENICSVIERAFSETKHPVWEELYKYYCDNITENLVAEVYNENIKVCSNLLKNLDEQIQKWMRVSATPHSMDFETLTISSWNSEDAILKDFINYLEVKSKEEGFKSELNNCCKGSEVLINSVNGYIPMTNDKKFKFVDYYSPADEAAREELAQKSYKKREVRYTRGTCPDDIAL